MNNITNNKRYYSAMRFKGMLLQVYMQAIQLLYIFYK